MKMLAIVLLAPLAACSFHDGDRDSTPGIQGSGSGTTRTYQAAGFTAVDLRGSDDVAVQTGGSFAVRAEGPSSELDKLKIVKDGDTLRIGRINDHHFFWGGNHSDKVKIYVTMPGIADAHLTGSGDMNVDKASGAQFAAATTGSGDLTVADVAVDNLDLDVTGSGSITIKGSAKHLGAQIAGSGDIDAGGLKASGAKVSIMGSGGVKADVSGAAAVSIMGSGDADLGPNATCTTSKMGSGSATCGH